MPQLVTRTHRITVEQATVTRTTYLVEVPEGEDPLEVFGVEYDGQLPAEAFSVIRHHREVLGAEPA